MRQIGSPFWLKGTTGDIFVKWKKDKLLCKNSLIDEVTFSCLFVNIVTVEY